PDPGPGPDDLVAAADLARRLGVGVQGLSRRDALTLALVVDLGFGPAEVAVALGVSEGNAKVILHRARRRLRQAVAEA
ncbi:MAG TPA: sigma factor-like helix-turn-helix DNA-binding protein, partial [Iamia sp.]